MQVPNPNPNPSLTYRGQVVKSGTFCVRIDVRTQQPASTLVNAPEKGREGKEKERGKLGLQKREGPRGWSGVSVWSSCKFMIIVHRTSVHSSIL